MGGNRWLVSELPQGRFQRKQVQLFIVEPRHQALECDIRCSPTRKCAYANHLLSERLYHECLLFVSCSQLRKICHAETHRNTHTGTRPCCALLECDRCLCCWCDLYCRRDQASQLC